MAKSEVAKLLLKLVKKYPYLFVPALGTATGAGTGAIFSDPGEEGRGALQGAILGGAAGTGAGLGARAVQKMLPTAEHAALIGAASGGTVGGVMGQRRLTPATLELLKMRGDEKDKAELKRITRALAAGEKEAAAMAKTEEEKQAEDKAVLRDRLKAFDYGMDLFFQEEGPKIGLDKSAAARAVGVEENEFAPAAAAWMRDFMEAAQKAQEGQTQPSA